MLQLVIRNNPQQWCNCLERLKKDFRVPEEICAHLRRGETVTTIDPAAQREIELFMNLRLPSHGRTLQGLAAIRDQMLGPAGLSRLWPLKLGQIIWPRQKHPSGDTEAKKLAAALGVTILNVPSENPRPLDLGSLLKHVQGDFFWILPGGSRLSGPMTIMALIRVLRSFQDKPQQASYSDQCYSVVYRTAALRALTAGGSTLSAELRENARMLHEAGYELAADNDPIHALAEIESLYGGKHNRNTEARPAKDTFRAAGLRSWCRRILRLE